MEGPHSPFGFLWMIASATGWSKHYIHWRVDYLTLRLMIMDQPRYVSVEEQKRKLQTRRASADDGSDIAALFESELKNHGYK